MPQSSNTTQQQYRQSPSQWSPEKKYLMDTFSKMEARGGTTTDFWNYAQHWEKLSPSHKRALFNATVNPPASPEEARTPGTLEGLSLHALQGITFGFGDETVGGLLGVMNGQSWGEGVREHRQLLENYAEEHRIAALAADIGGGFLGFGLGSLGAKLAGKAGLSLGRAGRGALRAGEAIAAPQRSLAAKAAQAAGIGAVGGAARGAGEGQGGLGERLGTAVGGGVAGAVLGPLLVIGGTGILKVGAPVIRKGSKALSAVSARLGIKIPGVFTAANQGRALIVKSLAKDKVTPDQLRDIVSSAHYTGQPLTFAEVLVEAKAYNTLSLLDDAVRTRDSNLQRTLEDVQRLFSRQIESGDRTVGFVADRMFRQQKIGTMALGDAQDALMGKARATSGPLYAKAYTTVADVGRDLRDLLVGKGGYGQQWRTAYERARERFVSRARLGVRDPEKYEPVFGEVPTLKDFLAGSGRKLLGQDVSTLSPTSRAAYEAAGVLPKGGTDNLPVRFIDYMKQELDEIVEPVYSKMVGTETQSASRAGKKELATVLHDFLRNTVDPQVPVYADARAAFAGDVSMAKASEIGRKSYGSRVTADQVARGMDALKTTGEKNMYRLGWLQGLADDISRSNGKAIDFSQRFFGGNPTGVNNNRINTIQRLFPRAQDADEVIAFIHREARMYEVLQRSGRRPAAALQEVQDELSGHIGLPRGITGGLSVAPGRTPGVFARVLSAGVNRIKQPFVKEVSDELSSLFLRGASTPEELEALIAYLIGPGSRSLQRQMMLGVAGRLTAGQQAEQFAENPLVPVVAGVEASAQGLGSLLNRLQ